MKRKPLSIFDAAKPFRDAFHYDPGHSDLDNEQPINITVTLGDWRKLDFVLMEKERRDATRGDDDMLLDVYRDLMTGALVLVRNWFTNEPYCAQAEQLASQAICRAIAPRSETRRINAEAGAALIKGSPEHSEDMPRPAPAPTDKKDDAWRSAALRLGEQLATTGPNGYYSMTPTQWLEWCQSALPSAAAACSRCGKTPPFAERCTDDGCPLARWDGTKFVMVDPVAPILPAEPTTAMRVAIWNAMWEFPEWHGDKDQIESTDRIYAAVMMFCTPQSAIAPLLKAIDDEPEVPGPMPDEMWEAVRYDRDACEEMVRIAVRQTKRGIRDRVTNNAADRTTPPE